MASPVTHWAEELDLYMVPAVNGTTSLLKGAQTSGYVIIFSFMYGFL